MARTKLETFNRPPTWCAVAVALSALVGVWHARKPAPNTAAPQKSAERCCSENKLLKQVDYQQIESTLAQAGCPGWMVMASEGPRALDPPPKGSPRRVNREGVRPALGAQVVPATVKEVAARVPVLKYPVPLRVAQREPIVPKPTGAATLSVGSADDPDDLLSGVPDLLAAPPEADPEAGHEDPDPTSEGVREGETHSAAAADINPPEDQLPEAVGPSQEVERPEDLNLFAPPQAPRQSAAEEVLAPLVPSPPPVSESPFAPLPAPGTPAPHGTAPADDNKTYCQCVAETQYPSAQACAKCHEKIYDEWRVSSHAYASISPMFHKFEQKINDLSQGTIGYFCYRCHSPVGTSLGISRAAPMWDQPLVVREGVTCVACHRVNQRYGKVNGERRIEPGNIHAPVYGSIGGASVAEVVARKDEFKVKASPHDRGPGQDMHVAGIAFDQLGKSEFCVSCHQVAVHPGIKLEVVWEQYRASPACKKGISCQDCHMGRLPGVPSGYAVGATAKVADKVVNPCRKHANHVFYGPGYSIAHPGVFPHNRDANRWSMRDWLLFEWRSGWGTDEFERQLAAGEIGAAFPSAWVEADDRYDAREIINDNLAKLGEKRISRQQVLENGSHVDGPYFDRPMVHGRDLRFHYVITNTNEGHNLPSGSLGAQPQLWANVSLIGPNGQRLWESGYTDRWGDVADIHSVDVRNKRIPYDRQLFNLQTMFLVTGAKGTDREFFLPINLDIDQLPYIRPGAQPISVINHPLFIRMEGQSLPPLGSRRMPYKVPARLLQQPGCYRLSFRLRSRAEPIYFMRFCGSTREMDRAMNEWMVDFHQSSVKFEVR